MPTGAAGWKRGDALPVCSKFWASVCPHNQRRKHSDSRGGGASCGWATQLRIKPDWRFTFPDDVLWPAQGGQEADDKGVRISVEGKKAETLEGDCAQ